MSEPRTGDPGLRPDYFAKRVARLHRRGDVVRKYKDIAKELHDSIAFDIREGRTRAALIHFRSFADYCLNCLFVAYAASEDDLGRGKTPADLVDAAKRVVDHWNIPVNSKDMRRLKKTYHDLSQAAHGTRKALESFERMRPDLIPSVQGLTGMLLGWVQEADRRLNGHRGQPGFRALMSRINASE